METAYPRLRQYSEITTDPGDIHGDGLPQAAVVQRDHHISWLSKDALCKTGGIDIDGDSHQNEKAVVENLPHRAHRPGRRRERGGHRHVRKRRLAGGVAGTLRL